MPEPTGPQMDDDRHEQEHGAAVGEQQAHAEEHATDDRLPALAERRHRDPRRENAANIASLEVAAHTAAGSRTSAGATRRAVASPATVLTATSTAATAPPQEAMSSAANQPGPAIPRWSSAHGTSVASGGWPATCTG